MKIFKHTFLFSSIVLICLALTSCHRYSYRMPLLRFQSDTPVGVDSLVIARTDSIIAFLFVDFASERKANELAEAAQGDLSAVDSLWKLIKANRDTTIQSSGSARNSNELPTAESNLIEKKILSGLDLGERRFQQSIKLNPFLLNAKDGLAQIYILRAQIEKPTIYLEKAAAILADLVQAERSEHILCYRLGECYFQLGKWSDAFSNYQRAEKIFLGTQPFFNGGLFENKSNDYYKTELLFNYLYSQAVCLARLYQSKEALRIINQARELAPNDSLKMIAERFKDWINWDKGNIYTAEQKSQIMELIKEQQYQDAAIKLESLKSQLTDSSAINEIEWRIAGLEFNYLNNKEQACAKLLKVIARKNHCSNLSNRDAIDFDTYLNDCGIMHFHLGMEFIDKTDYKQAQKYLERGATINWFGNYKCQLELAKLNRHDPQISLSLIEKVLTTESTLTDVEKIAALEIKLGALKKLGPHYRSEAKQVYDQIRELQSK